MAYEIKYRSDNEMKDSGIEWLGKIPKEWEVRKYKDFAISGMGNTILKEELDDEGFPVYSATEDDSIFGYLKEINLTLNKGDIVIPARGTIGHVYLVKEKIATCTQTTIYSKIKNINNKFLVYCAKGLKEYWFVFDNTAIPQITVSQVQNNLVPVPPCNDQQKIANFLDIKTSEFDSIISKKELLIEKLEEAKKSLISEVVTGKVKIVDGELVEREPEEMKDSGVEWLGMIPKDWEVKRLKYLVNLKSKKTVPKNDEKYIGLENIESKTGKYLESNEEEFIAEGTSNIFNKNDVLFGKLRPYLSKCIVADFDGVCSSEILVFEPREIIPQLLKYYILNDDFIDLVNSSTYGAKMPRASWDFIGNTYMPYFSLLHQKTIIQYLDNASNKMDSIITKTKKQITKLKEAKQSLISEAVTGKIDLRDWEIIETGGR
ncbi:MAG: restriction endonuclease subunit S [Tissierellaceae bacterium]